MRVLVANRGEIALRIGRACRRLGIPAIACATPQDVQAKAPHTRTGAGFEQVAVLRGSIERGSESGERAVGPLVSGRLPLVPSAVGSGEEASLYLDADALVEAALRCACTHVHPGYGFLSESAEFAAKVIEAGLGWIGPTPASIALLGDKSAAKAHLLQWAAQQLDSANAGSDAVSPDSLIPVIPGYHDAAQDSATLVAAATKVGFPCLIKAAAGGGGKGMRIARKPEELPSAIESAKSEAKRSFGDERVLVERYFDTVRHIEVQILGDTFGNITHVWERECSVQRRHQKVIEEAPSPALFGPERAQLRQNILRAAEDIARSVSYVGAGTVEFILDCSPAGVALSTQGRGFYFLEVNTRLQVEHPVTECVTGLDLVECQLRIAGGESLHDLGLGDGPPPCVGHAMETRVCAEDPLNSFFPCIGRIALWQTPQHSLSSEDTLHRSSGGTYGGAEHNTPLRTPGARQGLSNGYLRVDSGVETGTDVTVHYDPMLAKVIAYHCEAELDATAESVLQHRQRSVCVRKLSEALSHTVLLGLRTNIWFLRTILNHPVFCSSSSDPRAPVVTTHFIEDYFSQDAIAAARPIPTALHQGIAAALFGFVERNARRKTWVNVPRGFRNNPTVFSLQRTVFTATAEDSPMVLFYRSKGFDNAGASHFDFFLPSAEPSRGKHGVVEFATLDVGAAEHHTVSLLAAVAVPVPQILAGSAPVALSVLVDGVAQTFIVSKHPTTNVATADTETLWVHSSTAGTAVELTVQPRLWSVAMAEALTSGSDGGVGRGGNYSATMPGKILKVSAQDGAHVSAGDVLVTLESMKMETKIICARPGIAQLHVHEGQQVDAGEVLVSVKEDEQDA